MTLKKKIYSINKEALLYYSQGMYEESLLKYKTLLKLVSKIRGLKNKEEIKKKIDEKTVEIKQKLSFYEREGVNTELSDSKKEIIKKLFSDAEDDPEHKKFEEALALAKFGQFSDSIKEMTPFLENRKLKIDAGRNIIRCYEAMEKIEDIIPLVNKWKEKSLFSEKEVLHFIESSKANALVEADSDSNEYLEDSCSPEIMEIDSVGIKFSGSERFDSDPIELDVSFQTGNHLSLIISSKEKGIIDSLDVGVKLKDMCFYSPIAVFKSTGIILSKHQIGSGPKKGDWCLDLEIKNPS
ncbi:MAG: hypothetical protein RBR53_07645 [Desulforegulaceae bacterium]|nr:hypothetical protein [Desulforegulaceae bacterium]